MGRCLAAGDSRGCGLHAISECLDASPRLLLRQGTTQIGESLQKTTFGVRQRAYGRKPESWGHETPQTSVTIPELPRQWKDILRT